MIAPNIFPIFCLPQKFSFLSLLFVVDVIDYPLPNFAGAVLGTAFDLYLRRADIGIETSIDSLTDECSLGLKVKILEQHGDGKNLCQRVGDIETFGLWP